MEPFRATLCALIIMNRVKINTNEITDWESFHDCFSKAFGFPDFYGRNMDAWIDCMTSLDCPDDGMTNVHTKSGKTIILELQNINSLVKNNEEIYKAIIECAAFVNFRKLEVGEPAVLTLSYNKNDT